MEDNEITTISIPVPEDLVGLVQDTLTAIGTGDRGLLDKNTRQAVYITNNRKAILNLDNPDHTPTEYMEKDEVNTAYLHALNTCSTTPEDCFKQVVIEHGVTEEYVIRAKDNPTYHSPKVVEENITHPSIQNIRNNKVLDIRSLKISTTPSQLIDRITKRKSVSDRLDRLEIELDRLTNKVDELEVSDRINKEDIRGLSLSIFGEEDTKQKEIERCRFLRSQRKTIKQIASLLNISESSVRRNLKK